MNTDISNQIRRSIEAILFVYGDPISIDQLADILQIDKELLKDIMDRISVEMNQDTTRGIYIRTLDNTYTYSTKPETGEIIKKIFAPRNRPPLTQASYETLSIIAYNQPVTRSQVESVRGVSSDSIITRLTEKNLIRECGTLDAPGRPTLFETTETFLKSFGLSSVNELPPMDMLMYGTLRDIETSIVRNAQENRDNQMTMDQLVSKIIPNPQSASSLPTEETDPGKMDKDQIVDISSAFFGNSDE